MGYKHKGCTEGEQKVREKKEVEVNETKQGKSGERLQKVEQKNSRI